MTAVIISGKDLAKSIKSSIASKVADIKGRKPGLAVVLVGDDPASGSYVRSKNRVATKLGFESKVIELSKDTSQEELSKTLNRLNQDELVDGILLQLPLPKHLSAEVNLELISPDKDVDGLHVINQGKLFRGLKDGIVPCTPYGVMVLIKEALMKTGSIQPEVFSNSEITDVSKLDLSGKNAVVIGRSILVGKPVASLLLQHNATVTTAHSRTKNLEEIIKNSDIIVAAAGIPGLIDGSQVKPGAIAIDVGTTRGSSGTLVGDFNFESVSKVAGAITPVPGGVGPMTVTMLMANTLNLWEKRTT